MPGIEAELPAPFAAFGSGGAFHGDVELRTGTGTNGGPVAGRFDLEISCMLVCAGWSAVDASGAYPVTVSAGFFLGRASNDGPVAKVAGAQVAIQPLPPFLVVTYPTLTFTGPSTFEVCVRSTSSSKAPCDVRVAGSLDRDRFDLTY